MIQDMIVRRYEFYTSLLKILLTALIGRLIHKSSEIVVWRLTSS